MKSIKLVLPTLLIFSIFLSGCFLPGKTEEERKKEELEESMEELGESIEEVAENLSENIEGGVAEAMKGVEKAISGLSDGEKKGAINFRKLKELMPESLAGMERTKVKGSTTGFAGFKASVAEATFKQDDKKVEIKLIDGAGLGLAIMGAAAWSKVEFDEESDDGYKRTTTFDGHKALEDCKNDHRRCNLSMIAHSRFVLTLEGRNVDMDHLKKMVRTMDIDQLLDMAEEAEAEAS